MQIPMRQYLATVACYYYYYEYYLLLLFIVYDFLKKILHSLDRLPLLSFYMKEKKKSFFWQTSQPPHHLSLSARHCKKFIPIIVCYQYFHTYLKKKPGCFQYTKSPTTTETSSPSSPHLIMIILITMDILFI